MTIKIGLVASPGSGKSTTAADVFVRCKRKGISVELIQEAAREEINKGWKLKHIAEQFNILRKQREKEDIVPTEIDVVITDSPTYLTYYYALVNCEDPTEEVYVLSEMYSNFIMDLNRYDCVAFLNRVKPYVQDGTRAQTEAESDEISVHLKALLDMHKVDYFELDGDESAVEDIMLYIEDNIRIKPIVLGTVPSKLPDFATISTKSSSVFSTIGGKLV
jgi:nicotinamide riboside kinase